MYSFDGDRTVSRLFVMGGNILAVTQQEPFFSYISIGEKKLITSFGRKGRAGEEMLDVPVCVNLREGGLQFFDFASKSLVFISIPEGVVEKASVPYKVGFRPLRMVEVDGKRIATGAFDKGSVVYFDSNQNIVTGEDFPFDTGTLNGIMRGAYIQSDIAVAPDSSWVLIRTMASDCFEIYKVSDNGIQRTFVNDYNNPPVIDGGRVRPGRSQAGYIRSFVDNEFVYLMFAKGNYLDVSNEGLLSDIIHIYDWKGNLDRILHLPQKVGAFCVIGSTLFGTVEFPDHSEIVEYELLCKPL